MTRKPYNLPHGFTLLLSEAVKNLRRRVTPVAWSWLDETRLRAELSFEGVSAHESWNLAFFAKEEHTVLLACLQPDMLHVCPLGEMRGAAILNLGDALLEGLAEGCYKFIINFTHVTVMEPPALQMLHSFKKALDKEGLAAGLCLTPPFTKLSQTVDRI